MNAFAIPSDSLLGYLSEGGMEKGLRWAATRQGSVLLLLVLTSMTFANELGICLRQWMNTFIYGIMNWMSPPPAKKFACWSPNPRCDGVWRWPLEGHQVWLRSWGDALKIGLVVLQEKTAESSSPSPPVSPISFSLSPPPALTKKGPCVNTSKRQHLDLGPPVTKTVINTFPLVSHPVFGILLWPPKQLIQASKCHFWQILVFPPGKRGLET